MIKTINYDDKVAIQNDTDVAEKNKITDENVNEIKQVVNNNAKELEVVKADTEDLKEDSQGLHLEKTEQNTKISKLMSNQIWATLQGESFHVEDSADMFVELEIMGNHYQETSVEGKNKYDMQKLTNNAFTVNNGSATKVDGKITLTSTANDCYTNTFSSHSSVDANKKNIELFGITVEPNTTYTFSINRTGVANGTIYAFMNDADYTHNGVASKSFSTEGRVSFSFTTKATTRYVTFRLGLGIAGNTITYSNVQIEKGNVATAHEAYTPNKPSFAYPSEIKTVNGNINSIVCNKNFCNFGKEIYTTKSVEVNLGESEIILNGTTDGAGEIFRKLGNIDGYRFLGRYKKGRYTATYFHNYLKATGSGTTAIYLRRSDKTAISALGYASADKYTQKFTLTEDTDIYMQMFVNSAGRIFDNYKIQILIEKEDTATDYVEHKEQVFTMPVQQEMLTDDYFDFKNSKETHVWAKVVLDGSGTWSMPSSNQYNFEAGIPGKLVALSEITYISDKYKAVAQTSDNASFLNLAQSIDFAFNFSTGAPARFKDTRGLSLADFKADLAKNNITVCYKLAIPTELDFTQEQIEVAKQLQKILTYKNVTNMYCTDTISPNMQLTYVRDIETYIKNLLGGAT